MKPLAPEFLISAAATYVGLKEAGGNNRGKMVELFLAGVRQPPGQPWCAAFVHHVGFWSHFDYEEKKSSWPLPATASCYVLGAFAGTRQVLVQEPLPGDVFLQYNAGLRRFAHTGIVVRVDEVRETAGERWYECTTIEGNTNEGGSAEGEGVYCRVRRLYPGVGDRFVRWVELEKGSKESAA